MTELRQTLEIDSKYDSILGDFEVAVDQVNIKELFSLVTDENNGEIFNALSNSRRIRIIKELLVSIKR